MDHTVYSYLLVKHQLTEQKGTVDMQNPDALLRKVDVVKLN